MACNRALKRNTIASGASMTTHFSPVANSVLPNAVRPTVWPASLVTNDICAITTAKMPVSATPDAM